MPFTLFFFAALLADLRRSALSVFKFSMNNTTSSCAVSSGESRSRNMTLAAILLLPPLICQLSSCSGSINGGFPGKAAVKEKVIVRPRLHYPPSCGFPDSSFV